MRKFTVPLTIAAALTAAAPADAAVQKLKFELVGRTAALGEARAEIAAYHAPTKQLFTTNSDQQRLNVHDLSDPANPVAQTSIDLSSYGGGAPTSVATTTACGGLVAVAVPGATETSTGTVEFFEPDGDHVRSVPAGVLPDSITVAPGRRTLLVANEGQPANNGSADPEGSVTRIVIGACSAAPAVKQIKFGGVPIDAGVRIFTPGSTAPQDLEPEYITVEPTGRTAYVSLQENNAIGVLDVKKGAFTAVKSLGFKDHSLPANALDASDRDGIDIRTFDNLLGMYQPDALGAYTAGGQTYVATANEGDARDYSFFAEEARVSSSAIALDPTAFPNPTLTKNQNELGRLNVTKTLGDTDTDGDYDKLYAFGGRSTSILNASGALAWDSGSFMETWVAANNPSVFGKSNVAGSPVDDRMDNKGGEPEGLAIGKVSGRTYSFVANERDGTIFAFDVQDQPGTAQFAGAINTREADLGPEGVRFIPNYGSPNGRNLVLVTNEISGTVAIYWVKVTR